jgi:uncharacterized protein (TIGR02246 family)
MALPVADQLDIRELIARYCHALDARDGDGVAATFTADGVLESTWTGRLEGREAIAAYFNARPEGGARHWVNSPVIEGEGDSATVRLYLASLRVAKPPPQFVTAGHYEDTLRKVDGRWLFAHRHIHFDGRDRE